MEPDVTFSRNMRIALWLSIFTIIANLIEGGFSTLIGFQDETLALFGFGIDSFIEVMSAIGITIMILRISKNPNSPRSGFEVAALRMTGVSFYILTVGLIATSIITLFNKNRPDTTIGGIIISVISLSLMTFLYRAKMHVGQNLNSDAIIADANCTKVCIYMSVVLLVSSVTYALTGFAFLDILGALGIAYFSYSEGKEAFEKAAGKVECACD
ncbi:MAG: cation efflux protein [Chloroflexi bacterium]|nr:MAG: cation efflux protein [Chloroflexota bacterium]